jgi:hypothetical protein
LSVQEIKRKIAELSAARRQRRKWLVGTSLCALGITTVCLLIVRNAAVGLLQDGPTHDEFVDNLTRQMAKQVLPQTDQFGIQASYGTLSLPDAVSPIDHNRISPAEDEAKRAPSSQIKQSLSALGEEKPNTGTCGAADDPQKPLGHFREQTVSEYQTTVTKIVNDLAAIRGGEGNGTHAGLSAVAVASLFISHVQEGLPKPAPENYSPQPVLNSSKVAR